jgi:tripartite-type tricarboxylate transporter receptor subunit TctC
MFRALLAAALALALASAVSAAELAIKVAVPPGALADTAGRLMSRHIGRFLEPGTTTIVHNVPGGGGMILLRMLLTTEPSDGSVVAFTSVNLTIESVLQGEGGSTRSENLRWIGALSEEPHICMVREDVGVSTIEEFLAAPLTLAATAPTGAAYREAAILKNLFGTGFKIIAGFSGAAEATLAIERGEADGGCGIPLYSFLSSELSAGKRIIGYFGPAPAESVDPIPSFYERVAAELDRAAVDMLTVNTRAVFSIAVPPDTPDDAVARLRGAFNAMIVDPDFVVEATQVFGAVRAHTGEQLDALVADVLDTDPSIVVRARELIK